MTSPEPSSAATPKAFTSTGPVGVNKRHVLATYVRVPEKTPAAIRDALDPAEREQFEMEYRAALARAAETLDLEPVLTLVQRTWWVRAVMNLNPHMLDGVAADVESLASGDESILADRES